MMGAAGAAGMGAGGQIGLAPAGIDVGGRARGHWQIQVFDPTPFFKALEPLLKRLPKVDVERLRRMPWARKLRETRQWENLVTTEGKNHLLASGLDAATQITQWYLGLTDGTPTAAAGDTMASHAGWAEVTAYDEANRQTWTGGTAAAGSIDNSGNVATFTISADSTTIGGAFLTSNNTKGGTTGTLYAIGAFTGGDLVLNDGSTVDVTATFSV